jgi:hypothetical protein
MLVSFFNMCLALIIVDFGWYGKATYGITNVWNYDTSSVLTLLLFWTWKVSNAPFLFTGRTWQHKYHLVMKLKTSFARCPFTIQWSLHVTHLFVYFDVDTVYTNWHQLYEWSWNSYEQIWIWWQAMFVLVSIASFLLFINTAWILLCVWHQMLYECLMYVDTMFYIFIFISFWVCIFFHITYLFSWSTSQSMYFLFTVTCKVSKNVLHMGSNPLTRCSSYYSALEGELAMLQTWNKTLKLHSWNLYMIWVI